MCDGHMGHPTKRPCDLLLTHDHTGQCAECGCSGTRGVGVFPRLYFKMNPYL